MTSIEFLERIIAIAEDGSISDEAVSNLSVEQTIADIDELELVDFLEAWDEHSEYSNGLRLTVDNQRAFEASGGVLRVNAEELDALSDRDVGQGIDVTHYRDRFDHYYPENIEEVAKTIHEFGISFIGAGADVKLNFGLQKQSLGSDILLENIPKSRIEDVQVILWWSPEDLYKWIESSPIKQVTSQIFDYEKPPVFLFIQEAPSQFSPVPILDARQVQELSSEELEEAAEQYISLLSLSRRVSHWRGELSPLHPTIIKGIWEECGNGELNELYVHSLLGNLSAAVEQSSGKVKYYFSNEPEFAPEINLDDICQKWGEEGILSVQDLYLELKSEEEKDAFRDLWQLSITQHCQEEEEGVEALPEIKEGILATYNDLQTSAVEENFEALSDVLEDTQSLMAGLTERLSSAASETSRDIQRLTFTLLGAVVANIFLVLRWSDRSLIPPFSLFVIIVIVGFYLPVIQGRINDLDKIISEVKNDYEFYEKHIRRFNKELFKFGNLEERKTAYVTLADKQRKRAQTQLHRVFIALHIVWSSLAIWIGITNSAAQTQPLALIISGIVLAVLRFAPEDKAFGHKGQKYFDENVSLASLLIISVSSVISLVGLEQMLIRL